MVELADEGNSRPAQAGGRGPGEEPRQGHGRLHNELLGHTRRVKSGCRGSLSVGIVRRASRACAMGHRWSLPRYVEGIAHRAEPQGPLRSVCTGRQKNRSGRQGSTAHDVVKADHGGKVGTRHGKERREMLRQGYALRQQRPPRVKGDVAWARQLGLWQGPGAVRGPGAHEKDMEAALGGTPELLGVRHNHRPCEAQIVREMGGDVPGGGQMPGGVVDDGGQAPSDPADNRRSPMIPNVHWHNSTRVPLQNREEPRDQVTCQVPADPWTLLCPYPVEQSGGHVVRESGGHPQTQLHVTQLGIEGPAA